jgi:hypothetical protein
MTRLKVGQVLFRNGVQGTYPNGSAIVIRPGSSAMTHLLPNNTKLQLWIRCPSLPSFAFDDKNKTLASR